MWKTQRQDVFSQVRSAPNLTPLLEFQNLEEKYQTCPHKVTSLYSEGQQDNEIVLKRGRVTLDFLSPNRTG